MTYPSPKKSLQSLKRKPSKGLGQCFLVNKTIAEKLVKTACLTDNDTVIEIGPGTGVLTELLLKNAKEVIAIEKDEKMIACLTENLKDFSNLKLIQGDGLEILFRKEFIFPEKYKVVANIPFYLTAPLIRGFLETEKKPEIMSLLIQEEVAQRICSQPPKMNLLAVSVQVYSEVKIVSKVKSGSFWPIPNVNGAIIQIIPFSENSLDKRVFFEVLKRGFSHPRKKLINNLNMEKNALEEIFAQTGVSLMIRPERLSVEQWKNLALKISERNLL